MADALDPLRRLFLAELDGTLTGRALIEACTELALVLQRLPIANTMDEELWHYLSDADIRLKDERFAQVQRQQVRTILSRAPEEAP